MRAKTEAALLKKIAGIRRLQRAAAEAEAARAVAALSEKAQALKLRQDEEKAIEEHWQSSVSGPSVRLETMPIWAEAVARQNTLTRNAAAARDSASYAKDRGAAALYQAERQSDAAAEQARLAWSEHLRKLEDDAVQDAADRHLQHGGTR